MLPRLFLGLLTTATVASTADFYVSLGGSDDTGSGAESAPFRSWARAAAAAAASTRGAHGAPATVWIGGGTYTHAVELGPQHSGTAEAPITFRPAPDAEVLLTGGRVLDLSKASIVDPKSGVYELSLANVVPNNTELGSFAPGTLGQCTSSKAELFYNGEPMTLSRYPDVNATTGMSAFMRVASGSDPWGPQWFQIQAGADAPFAPGPARVAAWAAEANATGGQVWFHGYWGYDWADSYVRAVNVVNVASNKSAAVVNVSIDASTRPQYNFLNGGRVVVVNARSELDAEGEYYLDAETKTLHFIPPRASRRVVPGDTLHLSLLPSRTTTTPKDGGDDDNDDNDDCLLCLAAGTAHVTFQDIKLGYTRGTAVNATGVRHVELRNVTVENVGRHGIVLDGDAASIVDASVLNAGCVGISISGGNLTQLSGGGVVVRRTRIRSFGRIHRTYNPGLRWDGVGHVVAGSSLSDGPHAAIFGGGVGAVFDSNVIERVCYETSDAGAFYSGRRWDQRGNVILNTTFRSIRTRVPVMQWPPEGSVMGIYLDDEMSGYSVINCTFDDVQHGILLGGGRRNSIVGNRFKHVDTAVHVDARGEGCFDPACFPNCPGGFCSHAATIMQWLRGPDALPLLSPAWLARFPHLAMAPAVRPGSPVFNTIVRNTFDKGTTKAFLDPNGLVNTSLLEERYWTIVADNNAAG